MAPTTPSNLTIVKHSPWYHVFLWVAFPLVGAAAGWLLAQLPGWAEGKSLPFSRLLEAIYEHSGTVMTLIVVAIGAVVGVLVTLTAYDEVVSIEISDTGVEVKTADQARSYRRDQIDSVFADGKTLVLQARDTSELVRQKTDHKPARLQAAFQAHGYPWHENDPHEAEFSRWVDGVPGLGDHGNAILRARQIAIDADKSSDIVELHAEAAKVGVVVRDVKKRQYWRLAGK